MINKKIKFNIKINGVVISNIESLRINFSVDILPIYQDGRLVKWLKLQKLHAQSEAVAAIDKAASEFQQLAAICRAIELDADIGYLQSLIFGKRRRNAEKEAASIRLMMSSSKAIDPSEVLGTEIANFGKCISDFFADKVIKK